MNPRFFVAAFCVASLSLGSTAVAEAWEAKEVLGLAVELDEAIATVLALAPEAPQQDTAFQQRTRDAAVVQMKRAQQASHRFVTKLRLGWSRGETESHWSVLSAALEGVGETAQDAVAMPNTRPYMERIEVLRFELEKRYQPPE